VPASLTLPAASVAVTDTVYGPSTAPARSRTAVGPQPETGTSGETLHLKVTPVSESVSVNDGERPLRGEAGAVKTGTGGAMVSRVYDAVVPALELPAASTAETVTE
jgi:hypothetical protein